MKIMGTVIGDEAINTKFGKIEANAVPILEKRIARVVFKLEGRVKARKLSGQVLKVRSGTLRRSIHSEVETANNRVVGRTGTNLEYAVHEYGFQGTVNVKAHLRRTKTEAKLYIKGDKKGTVNLAATKKAQREKAATIQVRAHTREMNLPERSFLRSALKDMKREIVFEVYDSIKEMASA